MFVEIEEKLVNLDRVYFIKKEKLQLQKDGAYLLMVQYDTAVGYMTFKYNLEAERDAVYDKVKKALGDRLIKA